MEKQESGGREGNMDDGGRDVGMNRGRTRSMNRGKDEG